MKPTTDSGIGHERKTSTGTSDVQSFTLPRGTSHIDLQAFTVDAWVTFDTSTPSATNGLLIYAGQMPLFRPLGQGTTVKFASSSGSSSTLHVAYYQ